MKQQLFFGLILLLLMVLLPLASLAGARGGVPAADPTAAPPRTETAAPPVSRNSGTPPETLSVVRSVSGVTEAIPVEEYLVGCVAAEILPSSHEEAIKAQAVASYTYARYRLENAQTLSDDSGSDQGYISKEERQTRWGGSFETWEAKIERAVRAVYGQTITYEGVPIFAAYHAVSPGKTESAETYWGEGDYPYLQSVESPGDKLSPDYSKTVTFSAAEVEKALKPLEGVKPGKDPSKWFGTPERSDAGTVLLLEAGGKKITGRALREALGLRSADFTITYKNETFSIACKGYGHGVGMSQYGADFMARQGSDYKEILLHYYTGCEVM